jgi:GrpB-like predicted nucleotidyltransferase (UPF0157 family)
MPDVTARAVKAATGRRPKQGRAAKPAEERPARERPARERYVGGVIVVSDYDPAWPRLFKQESANLRAALGRLVVRIEHMGSTAVPGLPSKPVIDLLVGVSSLAEARARCIKPLEAMGYAYVPEYEAFLPGELFFRRLGPVASHHLHVMEPSNPRWERFLAFRDYLRAHPRAARAYADLKRALAAKCRDDIAAYRTAKHDFIEKATEKGLAEQRRSAGSR